MANKETKKKKGWSRRKFLIRSSIGVGVVVGTGYFTRSIWRRYLAGIANTLEAPYQGTTTAPGLWFEITAQNQIILHSPKVEMGQGTFTGLAQIAADELEVNVSQVQVVHAETMSGNIDTFATGGSTSISSLWTPLREIAATMREMVKNEAAKQMGTTRENIKAGNGIVTDGNDSFTYGEIVARVAEWEEVDTPELKDISEYKFVGKPVARIDLNAKVKGDPIFGMDAEMPGMLYGAVLRPSMIDARLVSADTAKAEGMPGVVMVVKEEDFVGIIANSYYEAESAKNTIEAEWSANKTWQYQDIANMIKVGQGDPQTIQKSGSTSGLAQVEGLVSAEYTSPMGAHAQIEPNGAVAHVEADRATVIMSTQVIELTRKEIARRLDFDKSQVNIKPTYLGGGFGRRLHTPNAIQAAVMSKAVGKPVKSFFSRQEEFQNDTFRPPTHHVLQASLSEDGLIESMEHNLSSGDVALGSPMLPAIVGQVFGSDVGAWRGGMIQYSGIPNYKAVSWRVKLPFATSWWRSLGLLANTFAIESFMDELAIKAGKNPVEFRLAQIDGSDRGYRLKEVIKAAAEKAGYSDEVSNGRAMGFACSTDANTPCAQVAEVSIEKGQIKVHKVTCAMDPGLVVNPDQVRAQCEGSVIMGMSASMFEKMDVIDNQLKPTIYGAYKMARMKHAPKEIDVVLLQNADAPGAVGEPPLGPIGAAIANAVFRLTGQRLRDMPLKLA
ncbi:MAG: xanthine dehydrogenase family protein molybdopterin-binding subunit [Roseivirga sp.]|nr:xanthine dehydrogenase family protein molybdopterin-binding subunit [Roseivirga sp.]